MKTKERPEDLAIFGARPAFVEGLHVGRPNIGNRERLLARINDVLDRRWLTNDGPLVQDLEQRIAHLVGSRHCIAVCNATIALEIVVRAVGLKGEVIVPAFTFIATAHALQWQEITPTFCDIDARTHNIDPKRVAEMITPRTSGIIGVHLWGRPCNITALTEMAQRYGLALIFDAAHSFACSSNGRMIGNFGQAEVFSFHATKFLNTFEGGAVVTNDDELAAKIRLMRNFGFAGYDRVIHIGTNGKMSEVCAAMGLTSLESLDYFVEVNCRNYMQYRERLAPLPGISLIEYDNTEKCNYQYIILEIDQEITGLSRDELKEILWAENVYARRYFYPGCHRMEPYRSRSSRTPLLLPQTERLSNRVLSLPTGTGISSDDIDQICSILHFAIRNGDDVRHRMLALEGHNG